MGISLLLTFIEGILAFISPCILPMLPVYLMYLAGDSKNKRIFNTLAFIMGFTLVFVMLGATATGIGRLLDGNRTLLRRVGGVVIVMFGLNFMGVIKIGFLNSDKRLSIEKLRGGLFRSFLFGIVFSLGWSPCLGTFLGSALMLAGSSATILQGMFMLFVFSMGLGLPFFITAMIYAKLEDGFAFIKKHYNVINIVSGCLLVIIGMLMITNIFGLYERLFNFLQ